MESTMDQIFGGILRSDVVCATCGYTSTAHDPFKDISVDIPEVLKHIPQPPHVDTPKPNPVKSGRGRGNGRGSNGEDMPSACLVKKLLVHDDQSQAGCAAATRTMTLSFGRFLCCFP